MLLTGNYHKKKKENANATDATANEDRYLPQILRLFTDHVRPPMQSLIYFVHPSSRRLGVCSS
jgi:hypothetical protein